jgi:hypothetical protein
LYEETPGVGWAYGGTEPVGWLDIVGREGQAAGEMEAVVRVVVSQAPLLLARVLRALGGPEKGANVSVGSKMPQAYRRNERQ